MMRPILGKLFSSTKVHLSNTSVCFCLLFALYRGKKHLSCFKIDNRA